MTNTELDQLVALLTERFGPNDNYEAIVELFADRYESDPITDAFQDYFSARLVERGREK